MSTGRQTLMAAGGQEKCAGAQAGGRLAGCQGDVAHAHKQAGVVPRTLRASRWFLQECGPQRQVSERGHIFQRPKRVRKTARSGGPDSTLRTRTTGR